MRNYKYISVVLLLQVFFISCNRDSFFEIDYPYESPISSIDDIDKLINGAFYLTFSNATWYSQVSLDVVHERYTDVAKKVESSSIAGSDPGLYLKWGTLGVKDENYHGWNSAYRALGNINDALSFFEDYDIDNGEFPFVGKNMKYIVANIYRCKGELHMLRAVNYWYLARMYCPQYISPNHPNNKMQRIPYKVAYDGSLEGSKNPRIGTTQEIWDLIVEDLVQAKKYLPESYDPLVHPPAYAEGHPNKFAAAAFLARVYFQRREWEKCEIESSYVIEQSGKSLIDAPLLAWTKNTGGQKSSEVLWYIAYDRFGVVHAPKAFTDNCKCWYTSLNGGDGRVRPAYHSKSKWTRAVWSYDILERIGWWKIIDKHWDEEREIYVVDDYKETDLALNDLRYVELNYKMEADPDIETEVQDLVDSGLPEQIAIAVVNQKYPNTKYMKIWGFPNPYLYCDKYFRADDGEFSHLPFIRLPELLLNRAIIKHKFGFGSSSPVDDINTIRTRAGLQPLSEVTEWDIERERIIELSWEMGDRLFYLRALGKEIGIGDRNPAYFNSMKEPYTLQFQAIPRNEVISNDSYKNVELPTWD